MSKAPRLFIPGDFAHYGGSIYRIIKLQDNGNKWYHIYQCYHVLDSDLSVPTGRRIISNVRERSLRKFELKDFILTLEAAKYILLQEAQKPV